MNEPTDYIFWHAVHSLVYADGVSVTKSTEVVVYAEEGQTEAINGFWGNIDLEYDPDNPPIAIHLLSITRKVQEP